MQKLLDINHFSCSSFYLLFDHHHNDIYNSNWWRYEV